MSDLSWLLSRPIAHRGLHDPKAGRFENTRSAAAAAVENDFAIECDVQLTADGEAVVFHDFELDRLTAESGPVATRSATELGEIAVGGAADTIATLADFIDLVAGRVPLVIEVKSRHDGDLRLVRRVAEIVGADPGPVVVKSFDPDVIAELRLIAPRVTRGVVGQSRYEADATARMGQERTRLLTELLHVEETRPDFVSWRAADLPCATAHLPRALAGLPVMTWTVRDQAEADRVAPHADQIVFEGFTPRKLSRNPV